MRESHQAEVAALAMVSAASDMSALSSFDHGDDGFDLGASSISDDGRTGLALAGDNDRSPALSWDDRAWQG